MKSKLITIEEIVTEIDRVLDNAENNFYEQHQRYPSLLDAKDYILLAHFLKIKCRGSKNPEYPIGGDEIGYRLMLKTLQRGNFFEELGESRQTAMRGILGRVLYTHSIREAQYRSHFLDRLISEEVQFPSDWKHYIDAIEKIQVACLVGDDIDNRNETEINEFSIKEQKEGYRIGIHLVNPSGHYKRCIKNAKNWENLKEIYVWLFKIKPTDFPAEFRCHNYW